MSSPGQLHGMSAWVAPQSTVAHAAVDSLQQLHSKGRVHRPHCLGFRGQSEVAASTVGTLCAKVSLSLPLLGRERVVTLSSAAGILLLPLRLHQGLLIAAGKVHAVLPLQLWLEA